MDFINLHVLNVEHGDSIVIEFPGSHWGIIDCFDPRNQGEPPALTFLKNKEVKKLDFICLTHPHYDHYKGMIEIFKYFTSDDRKIEQFWDFGIDKEKLSYLKRKLSFEEFTELDTLYDLIFELVDKKKEMKYLILGESTRCLSINTVRINSYAPLSSDVLKYVRNWGKDKRVDENLLSAVLIITYKNANIVLGADTKSWEDILKRWSEDCKKIKREPLFVFIKVSHHGSRIGNHKGLWKSYTIPEKSVAIISTGCKYGSPHRETVTCILNEKIKLYSTNFRDFSKVVRDTKPLEQIEGPKISDLLFEGLQYFTSPVEEHGIISPYHGNCSISIDKDSNSSVETEYELPSINLS